MPENDPKPKIEFDAIVEKVVSDPSKPVDSIILRGFVGRSAEAGNVRLYLRRDFSDYVEILSSDIIHHQPVNSQSPLRGSIVYVKPGARIRRVRVSAETEARFLQGQLISAFAGRAARGSYARAYAGSRALTIAGRHCTLEACVSDARTSCSDVCVRSNGCGGGGGGFSDDCGSDDCGSDDCGSDDC
jgi:hypothetical protein